MVEGGSALIRSLDEHGLWDEAWIVTTKHVLGQGIKAPILNGRLVDSFSLENDRIVIMHPERTNE